eukprot:TRINITY_DN22927_c0_g1_i1.p1 TRINITY_DN22927_c0_g1~~TRINITY_DN22927_c0_g1_i1.p1  ORF type:complete len:163 (+),score=17.05 TRINITY_DN22927_c0_g1_i1:52-540(+)
MADIHEESMPSPRTYDIMLMDVTSTVLKGLVSSQLGIQYLSIAGPDRVNQRTFSGVLYGSNFRPLLSLPITHKKITREVIFLLDTGAPSSYICEEAFGCFEIDAIPQSTRFLLCGQFTIFHLSPSGLHFKDVNVLGASALSQLGAKVSMDYELRKFEVTFNI